MEVLEEGKEGIDNLYKKRWNHITYPSFLILLNFVTFFLNFLKHIIIIEYKYKS